MTSVPGLPIVQVEAADLSDMLAAVESRYSWLVHEAELLDDSGDDVDATEYRAHALSSRELYDRYAPLVGLTPFGSDRS